MTDTIIKAENLGKKYTIGHQSERGGYRTLRELLVQNTRELWHKTRDLAQGKPVIQGDTFEEVWALRDVNFEIRRGEAVGIIGRNGAGKSTLLKILSRITEPTTGRVMLKGRVASLLEVGTGFHPELSGRENIYLNGAILGMTRAEITRKFDEIVAFAEVERYLDTPVKRYSSGMYVRLAFAVAAHLEPEILIVDEVLAVGDVEFQKKCLGKMDSVASEGRTVLFVSHNMASILQLCTKGILLAGGQIVSQGTASEVVNEYLGNQAASAQFTNKRTRMLDEPHIVSAQLIAPNSGQLIFGETLEIGVEILSSYECTVGVEVIIRDKSSHPIIFLPSGLRFGQEFFVEADKPTAVFCEIPDLPLAEGHYTIDLAIAYSGIKVLDSHSEVLGFDVVSSDPGGVGRSFTQESGQGSVHIPAIFRSSTPTPIGEPVE